MYNKKTIVNILNFNLNVMKRTLISLSLLVVSLVSLAQVKFGVQGGLNLSTESVMTVDGKKLDNDNSFKTGFHAGVLANIKLHNSFEFEPSVMYSMQGFNSVIAEYGDEQILNDVKWHVTSHYINIPLALKGYFCDGFYGVAGPQLGFLLSKKDKYEGFETESFPNGKTKKIDFSIFGGVGYKFKNNMFLEGRYVHGFTGTSKVFGGEKNRNIQISLGYYFK